jgi:hypothetical protein
MAGIKNMEEVAVLIEVIAVQVCKSIKTDGFQVSDLISFLQAPEFEEALQIAIDGSSELVNEAGDVGLMEGIQLARDLQRIVTHIAAALKATA